MSLDCCCDVSCRAVLCRAVPQALRSGEELEYEIEMQPLQTLVPVHKYDQLPSYFIYAGVRRSNHYRLLMLAR